MSGSKRDPREREEARQAEKEALSSRLFREGLYDEAAKLRHCGDELKLECSLCATPAVTRKSCKRRWCPECAWRRGADLCERFESLVAEMDSPLMLTLTVPHERGNDPVEMLGLIKSAFGRLRRQKWWLGRVSGGIGGLEISGGDNGWHLHLHLVLNCRWLAVTLGAPGYGWDAARLERHYKMSQREVAGQWALAIGSDRAHIWIKRANRASIREALKYSVKPGTLLTVREPLGPLIRGFKSRRLLMPWGTVWHAAKALRAAEKAAEADSEPVEAHLKCECGCGDWIPADIAEARRIERAQSAPAREYRAHVARQKSRRAAAASGLPIGSRVP